MPFGQGHKIVVWLRQDLNPGSINPEHKMEATQTPAEAGSEDTAVSGTDMMFSFTELTGKKLHLTTTCSEDVFDAGTLVGN